MERTPEGRIIVVADANILINFLRIGRMDILRGVKAYGFCIPNHVRQEISYPAQKEAIDQAIQEGHLIEIALTDLQELRLYAGYRRRLGDGEAACLAVAMHRRWVLASDEKRILRREVLEKLGEQYLLNTPGILVKAIREHIVTVEEADRIKDDLAKHRFVMKIRSFRDFI